MRLLAITLLVALAYSSFGRVNAVSKLDDAKSILKVNNLIESMLNGAGSVEAECADCVNQTPVLPGLTASFYHQNADCTNFIKSDGSYGPWGKIIERYILEEDNGAFLLSDYLEAVKPANGACKNWHNLTEKQRVHFWVWTMASIAWRESTCKPDNHNPKASDGYMGMGLFQMNELRSSRYWRGKYCNVSNIVTPQNNIGCSLDIMTELLRGQDGVHKTNGKLYGPGSNSYWEQLKNNAYGSEIGHRIRQFPLCQR